jgi:hypothetical protein
MKEAEYGSVRAMSHFERRDKMKTRIVVPMTVICLVVIAFAAGANAEVISRAGASSKNMTSNRPVQFTGPPTKIEVCEQEPFNDGAEGVADLIAGQYYDVGEVHVQAYEDMGEWYLRVTYQTTGDWWLTEYHVYVGDNPPEKSAPGQFPYGGEIDPATQEFVLDGIPFAGGCQIIAAHAVVEDRSEPIYGDEFDLDEFAASLPDCVDASGQHPASDLMAYFDVTVVDTMLTGDYYGWCVDTDRTITATWAYPADVWSSYEALPPGLIEHPENLDLVNWILNNGFVGEDSPGCGMGEQYTYGDVQRAIWALVDDAQATGGLGPWSECRVNEILAAAFANGEGFMPECGDLVGVILVPVDECGGDWNYQFIIIPVPAECDVTYGDETAWAKAGEGFDCGWKTGWGSYMQFCYNPEPD